MATKYRSQNLGRYFKPDAVLGVKTSLVISGTRTLIIACVVTPTLTIACVVTRTLIIACVVITSALPF